MLRTFFFNPQIYSMYHPPSATRHGEMSHQALPRIWPPVTAPCISPRSLVLAAPRSCRYVSACTACVYASHRISSTGATIIAPVPYVSLQQARPKTKTTAFRRISASVKKVGIPRTGQVGRNSTRLQHWYPLFPCGIHHSLPQTTSVKNKKILMLIY